MTNTSFQGRYASEIKKLRDRLMRTDLRNLEPLAGVSRATLFRVRQGRHDPRPETIDAIWAGIEALEQAENE